jgi:NADH:ubiquinone oxidoreductase subunit H
MKFSSMLRRAAIRLGPLALVFFLALLFLGGFRDPYDIFGDIIFAILTCLLMILVAAATEWTRLRLTPPRGQGQLKAALAPS